MEPRRGTLPNRIVCAAQRLGDFHAVGVVTLELVELLHHHGSHAAAVGVELCQLGIQRAVELLISAAMEHRLSELCQLSCRHVAALTALPVKEGQDTGHPDDEEVPNEVGVAMAAKLTKGERAVFTGLCEGSTNLGDFHEALTWAGVHRLSLIVIVENNEYAISVPMEKQMAIPRVSDRAQAYGVRGVTIDGLDPVATYLAMTEAVTRARSGEGATLFEARVVRLTPHSSDDDDSAYRSKEEKVVLKASDPLPIFRERLKAAGVLTDQFDMELDARVMAEVNTAHLDAERAPYPDVEWAMGPVYAA